MVLNLCTYKTKGNVIKLGALVDGTLIDLTSSGYHSLDEVLRDEAHDGVSRVKSAFKNAHIKETEDFTFLPPVQRPDKVLCIGMNYIDHCKEQNVPIPKEPIVFSKFPSSLAGAYDPVPMHDDVEKLDWEAELVIVIGKRCFNVPESEAMSYVLGFACGHDVSARKWQLEKNGGQWLLGKARENYGPFGPGVVLKEHLPDIHNKPIRCSVNGKMVQNSNTKQMVFKTEALISFISRRMTLLPGDVIFTGTPPGVGCFQKPPVFLKVGDVVECEIEGVGKTKNTIIARSSL